MRIAVIGDTFGELPIIADEYDIFIHCGNFCPCTEKSNDKALIISNQREWLERSFNPWLKTIPARHIIVMPGQSDFAVSMFESSIKFHLNAMYLRDETATVDGFIIHATPWVPVLNEKILSKNGVFLCFSEDTYNNSLSKIPESTDILITRTPPHGILDENSEGVSVGSKILNTKINSLENMYMHLFSFNGNGKGKHFKDVNRLHVNACIHEMNYMEIIA